MAFQFPDPSVTPEFTGANGITYSWDATDGKWVVKGFAAESVIGPCASSSNTICDQLTELEEEIDAIAPSVERGFWTMNLLGTVANQGQMSLYDDNYTNVGNPTGLFKDAKSIWLNELDNDGTPHGFNNVEAGELIELFVQGQSEYGLYEVVDVHDETNGAAQWWVIEVKFVRTLEDTSTADNGDLIRIKIFQPPEGGTADGFVLKTGDKMSGALKIGDVDLMPNGANTDSPKLYFANKNTSNTEKAPYLYSKANSTTIYSSAAIRAGAAVSALGNLQYNGYTRVGMNSNGGYLGNGTSESSRPLEWNGSGIFKLWGYNGEGEAGQVLKLDNSLRPYWGDAGGRKDVVVDGSWNSSQYYDPIKITRNNSGVYYIEGGS